MPQLKENPVQESQMVTGGPPASGTRSTEGPIWKPSQRLSGEKNGPLPRRPPGTGMGSTRSAYRTIRPLRD